MRDALALEIEDRTLATVFYIASRRDNIGSYHPSQKSRSEAVTMELHAVAAHASSYSVRIS